jgi:outer membrane usher protein
MSRGGEAWRFPRAHPDRTLALALCVAGQLFHAGLRAAEPDAGVVDFNPAFLQGGSRVDVSRFSRGNVVLAGEYLVDLQVNGKWVSRANVRFTPQAGSDVAQPCIEPSLFDRIGIDLQKLTEAARAELQAAPRDTCLDIGRLVQDAAVKFELSTLRLDISVPQASMSHAPRDFVDPAQWDSGVPSATLGYNLNAYRSAAVGSSSTRSHGDFLLGVNYGSWHLRQRSAVELVSGGGTQFQSIATYLTHDIPAIRSNLILGDSFTDGAVFDSFGFRGISLASSDQMLPESRREYAPVVRGIARTNARLVITQNGVTVLETTVSPGAFEINDLYATGYGGDLNVAIHEADGTEQNFIVPYSPMVQLLRPGIWRYTLTAGEVQQPSTTGSERFSQATLQHGISSLVTGYSGVVAANDYGAGLLGVALNTRVGAMSVDVAHARSRIDAVRQVHGETVRLGFSKLLRPTQTSITLAAYPFVSGNYHSLIEVQSLRQAAQAGVDLQGIRRMRRQWQIGINQNLPGRWGNFFLSASLREYWGQDSTATQLQAGYTNQLRLAGTRLSYGVTVAQQDNLRKGNHDRRVQMNFSLPLGHSAHSPLLSTSFMQDSTGDERTRGGQEVLIGSAGERHQFNYSIAASQADGDSAYTANGQYRGAYTSVSAGGSKGSGYSQQSLGATGGLVVHPGGVTLSNQLTDTFGIVEAPGAEGARVTNSVGTVVNKSGYAVLPFLLPYRMNTITIDPEGAASPDVEFKSTSVLVAPRLNSVVMVRFQTVAGRAVLITVRMPDGEAVPFGASVVDAQGNEVGLAGQDGRIYLRGVAESGALTARWGDEPAERCTFDYQLPAKQESKDAFVRLDARCRSGAATEGQ